MVLFLTNLAGLSVTNCYTVVSNWKLSFILPTIMSNLTFDCVHVWVIYPPKCYSFDGSKLDKCHVSVLIELEIGNNWNDLLLNIHHSDRDLLAQRENNGITVIKYTFGISETLLHLTPIQKSHFWPKVMQNRLSFKWTITEGYPL